MSETIDDDSVSSDGINYWCSRSSVREEIEGVIKRHKVIDNVPVFSTPELIVMAVLCSSEKALWITETMEWIVSNFEYYRTKVLREYSNIVTDEESLESPSMFVEDFRHAFDCWEAPLVDERGLGIIQYYNYHPVFEALVTVPVSSGRTFLRAWLEPKRTGVFPFLQLPAELRNTIYEMVFSFPATGIYVRPNTKPGHGVALLQREDDEFADDHTWESLPAFDGLESAPMQTVLALLSVNKQIYSEAMPYFYQTNYFYFSSTEAFTRFANRLPITRLQYLGHLSLEIDPGPYYKVELGHANWQTTVEEFRSAAKALAQVKSLWKFDIKTRDSGWFTLPREVRHALGRIKNFTKAEQLPGIQYLAIAASKARALEVRGDCPRIKAYLSSEADKLKVAGPVSPTEPKKRRKSQKSATKNARNINDPENEEDSNKSKKTKPVK